MTRELETSSRGVRGRVLILDDAYAVARSAARALSEAGYYYEICSSTEQARSALEVRDVDVVLADLNTLGPELLRQLPQRYPDVALIVLSTNPGVGSAIAAMRQGAFDYLVKPLDEDELRATVGRATEMQSLRRQNQSLRQRLDMAGMVSTFVAESPAGKHLLALIHRVAPTNIAVLIEGEVGTGKEAIVRMVHYWSDRSGGPFVTISCKGFAAGALEGEPLRDQPRETAVRGLPPAFERARGGTIVLDEIAEAAPALQGEIVRLLETTESSTAGGKPGVRIVATTSWRLKGEVDAGRFRADLFYRLSAFAIRVPPLRERREDILPFAHRFLSDYAAKTGRRMSLTTDAERELLAYSWPGNIRELRNAIERAAMLAGSDFVPSKSLELRPREPGRPEPARPEAATVRSRNADGNFRTGAAAAPKQGDGATSAPGAESPPPTSPVQPASEAQSAGAMESGTGTLQECLDKAARARIKAALEAAGGNRSDAAKTLEIDGTTLNRLIKRLGL